ncbi:OmpP1/FadL family transporter [Sungkyunkwania multivorans]|uniref:OmpP1/FadL family transporter n=1 Tax=Sungkyunkwania multivorans TaxID=1173618 RepID=A0ABW3CUW3_9FLAO
MKKIGLFILSVLAVSFSNAQDITDALRYSTNQLSGTARYRAMSGAFGALGGDLSAMATNPAGSAVFSTGEIAISLTSYNNDNDASYFGTATNASDSAFDIGQAGAVFVFDNTGNSDWTKFSLGFNYQNVNNFNDNLFVAGIGTTSVDQYFLTYAQGLDIANISAQPGESLTEAYIDIGRAFGFGHQQAFLGYESFILDLDPSGNGIDEYISNASYASGVDQEYSYATSDYNRKFTFNLAAQYKENLYLGLNLNSHVVDYRRSTFISEIGFDRVNDFSVTEIEFANELYTYGTGFSFQAGAIAKVNDDVRLGVSYQSPTWYRLNDELSQAVRVFTVDPVDINDPSLDFEDVVAPNVITLFDDYRLRTPGELTGSFAYIFGKQGLISFDYTRKDFGSAEFKQNTGFNAENTLISNSLKATNNYRLGAEYRIEAFSLRGGYRFEESPYENGSTIGDLTGFSVGAGYSFGGWKLDLAYDQAQQERNQQLFNVGLTDTAFVDNINSNVTLTLTLKL